MSSILPKALIMAQWNQDDSLTTSSKRHLGIWITKVKSSGICRLCSHKCQPSLGSPRPHWSHWPDKSPTVRCWVCHNPLLGVPVFFSQMTLSRSANTTRNLDVAAMYRSWPAPTAGKKDKWRAPEWLQSLLSHCPAIEHMARKRHDRLDLARMCV